VVRGSHFQFSILPYHDPAIVEIDENLGLLAVEERIVGKHQTGGLCRLAARRTPGVQGISILRDEELKVAGGRIPKPVADVEEIGFGCAGTGTSSRDGACPAGLEAEPNTAIAQGQVGLSRRFHAPVPESGAGSRELDCAAVEARNPLNSIGGERDLPFLAFEVRTIKSEMGNPSWHLIPWIQWVGTFDNLLRVTTPVVIGVHVGQ